MRNYFLIFLIILTVLLRINVTSADDFTLEASDGSTLVFESLSTIMTSDIIVKNNSTLILRNMMLQLSVRGEETYNITVDEHSTLILVNTNITSLSNKSIVEISNSSNIITELGSSIQGFETINLQNASTISFEDSELLNIHIEGSAIKLEFVGTNSTGTRINVNCSTIFIESSILKELNAVSDKLDGRKIDVDVLKVNCSTAKLDGLSSFEMDLHANDEVSMIKADAETSNVIGDNNVTIVDSSFGSLTMGQEGGAYNVTTSKVTLTGAGGMIYSYNESSIDRYWYLQINVTDITGFPIPATIEIYDHNKNLVKTVKTNVHGIYYDSILAEKITGNSTSFIGNYRLIAYFNITEGVMTLDTISTEKTVTMDTNKEVKLMFADVVLGLTSTNITLKSPVVPFGDKIKVNGHIKAPLGGEIVEITYTRPDGTEFLRTASTEDDGSFENQINADMAGRWAVSANWIEGSTVFEDSVTMSRKTYLYVEEAPSPVSIFLRVSPILIIVLAMIIGIAFLFLRTKPI